MTHDRAGSVAVMMLAIATAAFSFGATGVEQEGAVKLSYFGEVEIQDGSLAVMDGGIHGVSGHTIVVASDGTVRWARRVGSVAPQGQENSGQFRLTDDESARVDKWRAQAWEESTKPSAEASGDPPSLPRWVWAVVMRRGDEMRVLEGGSQTPTVSAPESVRELLEWMIERVDALASEPER